MKNRTVVKIEHISAFKADSHCGSPLIVSGGFPLIEPFLDCLLSYYRASLLVFGQGREEWSSLLLIYSLEVPIGEALCRRTC